MEVEQNKAVVRRFLDEVVGRGAFDVACELCTEDCVNHAAVPDRQRGIQKSKAVLEFSRSAQPDQRSVERRIVGDGDLVVVYGRRFRTESPVCYRASWPLPGPDSHRQATTSTNRKITPSRHEVTSHSAGRVNGRG